MMRGTKGVDVLHEDCYVVKFEQRWEKSIGGVLDAAARFCRTTFTTEYGPEHFFENHLVTMYWNYNTEWGWELYLVLEREYAEEFGIEPTRA